MRVVRPVGRPSWTWPDTQQSESGCVVVELIVARGGGETGWRAGVVSVRWNVVGRGNGILKGEKEGSIDGTRDVKCFRRVFKPTFITI